MHYELPDTKWLVPNAKNLWDELHYTHIYQGNYMHYVGHFLPWHRWFVRNHEILLQECGYTGGHPYWDEPYDLENAPLNESSIFDSVYGFGGNGADGGGGCITDGPVVDLELHMTKNSTTESYYLTRILNEDDLDMANSTSIAACMAYSNYTTAWECWNGYLHGAGHGAVGGLLSDTSTLIPSASLNNVNCTCPTPSKATATRRFSYTMPGSTRCGGSGRMRILITDSRTVSRPRRILVHFMLTSVQWAAQMSPHTISLKLARSASPTPPSSTNYYGDNGNITTPQHVLWMDEIIVNVTISDIMDLNGDTNCAEYV